MGAVVEPPRHLIVVVVAAIAAATLLAGCQRSEPPGRSGRTPAPPTQSASYNREERALYREALRRVEAFEARNQPLLAAGQATRQAKELYQRSLREWQSSYALLRSYDRDGITVAHRPVVLNTQVVAIESFQDDAAEVTLARCTDQSDLGMTRDGEPLPAVHAEPVIQEVVVYRYENRTWRIGEFVTTDRPCAG